MPHFFAGLILSEPSDVDGMDAWQVAVMATRSGQLWLPGTVLGWMLSSGAALAEPAQFVADEATVERVLELSDQRVAVMPVVPSVKWRVVIQRAADLGAPMGLAGDPLKHLFELQARLAREVQTALHKDSHAQPITTPATFQPEPDILTVDLLRALYVAAPALQRDDFDSHYTLMAQQKLHTAGWTDQNRHEILEALHNIRVTPTLALQRILSSGVLRVGTTGDYAPFSLEANGTLSGSDIDLAQKLAAQLHARAVFIHTSWSSMLDDLGHGAFDVGMGGVSITPAREAQAAFSVPYSSGGKTIVARCADLRKFGGGLAFIDKANVRLIVNPGGTNEQYVRSHIQNAQVIVFPDNRGIFDELSAKRADVMITDDVEAELQSRHHPELCRVFDGTLTRSDKAILMPRDPDFVKAVNDWLTPAIAAGEPARMLRDYIR